MEHSKAVPGNQEDQALPKESKKALVTKLVLIPLLIVSVAVGIFLFFGWLTYDHKSTEEFLADIKTASANKKWQAAFILAGKLRDKESIADPDGVLNEMLVMFKDKVSYDEKVRSYLAMALGNLGERGAIPALEDAAKSETGDVPIYAMWALGTLEAKEAIPTLLTMAESKDASFRKTALFVLGSLGASEALPLFKRALTDEEIDIRWNAALALARAGDRSGLDIITQLLDRSYFKQFPDMGIHEQSDAMINALRAVAVLKERSLEPTVQALSREDISTEVRRAAGDTLAAMQ